MKKNGRRSFVLSKPAKIVSSASFVGEKEGMGPLGSRFDVICHDDTLGLKSWEQAESRMLESAVSVSAAAHLAAARSVITMCDLDGPSLCAENPYQGGPVYDGARIRMTDVPGLGFTGEMPVSWQSAL